MRSGATASRRSGPTDTTPASTRSKCFGKQRDWTKDEALHEESGPAAREGGARAAGAVPHREMAGPALRARAALRPADLGVPRVRQGAERDQARLGRVPEAPTGHGDGGHALRDDVVAARSEVGGRAVLQDRRARQASPGGE